MEFFILIVTFNIALNRVHDWIYVTLLVEKAESLPIYLKLSQINFIIIF